MEENKKAKTIIERFGFKDNDLTTPKHDSFVLWIAKEDNRIKMLEELHLLPNRSKYDVSFEMQLEYSIMDRRYNIGFVDMVIRMKSTLIEEKKKESYEVGVALYEISKEHHITLEELEQRLTKTKTQYRLGERGALAILKSELSNFERHSESTDFSSDNDIFIEIKPQITSLGELIRQINMYRSHLDRGKWIVLTDTETFDDILKGQNILTYHIKER